VIANGKPPSLAASGWSYDGWNWCHFPGTTALERPAQDLFDGYAMYGNASAFAGGTQVGDDGLWAMDFCGGSGVQFKKSVFCFDNRITVITSGIQLEKKLHAPAVTTLYQNRIQPGNELVSLDGETIKDFPSERQVDGEKAHWLIDNQGTGYFIPSGHDPLQLACRKQEWTYLAARYLIDPKDNPLPANSDYQFFRAKPRNMTEIAKHYRPTTGDFALAYFNHGLNPADTLCSYTMVIQATPAQMAAFAADPPYQILQHDGHAHAVLDRASQTTGYALFEANPNIAAAGLLRANNQPCFVMLQGDGAHLRISVACTDIKRTEPVRLTLQGAWKLRAMPPERSSLTSLGRNTQLVLQPDYYMPMRVELEAGR